MYAILHGFPCFFVVVVVVLLIWFFVCLFCLFFGEGVGGLDRHQKKNDGREIKSICYFQTLQRL